MSDFAVLLSGRGSTYAALQQAAETGELAGKPRIVLSDRAEAGGLGIARNSNVPARALPPEDYPDRAAYESDLGDAVEDSGADWLVLAGYMRILGDAFVRRFMGRMINIHPSLLPAYRGLGTYRRALAAGERIHGTSVHFVTPELDGGPVIAQAEVPVYPEDDVASLRRRTKARERVLYPRVLDWILRGRVQLADGQVLLDGKPLAEPVRFPADREISACIES